MTDFIHEPPKEPQSNPAAGQETPPMDEKTGQKRVYGYIFILFIVAFSLLVWSFLMNQRGTDQVLSELRGNADALQTTLTRNVELERQVDALQAEIDSLEDKAKEREQQSEQLKSELADAKQHATAHTQMWMLEYYFAAQEYDYCRTIVKQLEEQRDLLQTGEDGTLPNELARYEEISAALAEMAPETAETQNVSHET